MENKVPEHIPPKPGIAEAIHPEIGNGVSWETNQHNFLLRNPDPTKNLDQQLSEIQTNLAISTDSERTEVLVSGDDHVSVEMDANEDLAAKEDVIPPGPDDSSIQEEHIIPPVPKKGKDKRERKKKTKIQDPDQPEGSDLINQDEADEDLTKTPKAGKLLRKAAKSVRKHEEKEIMAKAQDLPLPESTLSPYTQWLKSLKGSEYVHPYDDDFAFVQGSGPAKEGISETFAELLTSQGYKEQAVEMYMKLMEKYPEKSGFFAAKIEALQ